MLLQNMTSLYKCNDEKHKSFMDTKSSNEII